MPPREAFGVPLGACHRKPKLGTWSSLLAQKCGSSLPLWLYIDLRREGVKQHRNQRTTSMNAYLGGGLVCLVMWGVLVYGAGIGTGTVHILVAAGFVLIARGLLQTRPD